MTQNQNGKTHRTYRMSNRIIAMLDTIVATPHHILDGVGYGRYVDRTRTWIIEDCIERVCAPLLEAINESSEPEDN